MTDLYQTIKLPFLFKLSTAFSAAFSRQERLLHPPGED